MIVGVAIEIGIEPTVRQGADLGYIPVVVEDACGAGDGDAGKRALASLRYMGDAMFTTVSEITTLLRRAHRNQSGTHDLGDSSESDRMKRFHRSSIRNVWSDVRPITRSA